MKVSLLIPTSDTRDRYLETCLKTIGPVPDGAEVVVQRNENPRLSMESNWRRGVERCQGKWVCIIGDDDGLMPGALDFMVRATNDMEHRPGVLTWAPLDYKWTNYSREAWRGVATMAPRRQPVSAIKIAGEFSGFDSRATAYHGLVRRGYLMEMCRFGTAPDVGIGLRLCEREILIDRPLTVNGHSAASTGTDSKGAATGSAASFVRDSPLSPWFRGLTTNESIVGQTILEWLAERNEGLFDAYPRFNAQAWLNWQVKRLAHFYEGRREEIYRVCEEIAAADGLALPPLPPFKGVPGPKPPFGRFATIHAAIEAYCQAVAA